MYQIIDSDCPVCKAQPWVCVPAVGGNLLSVLVPERLQWKNGIHHTFVCVSGYPFKEKGRKMLSLSLYVIDVLPTM